MAETLYTLLERCTVRIVDMGGQDQGTGFFVAPGLVLTCAHVVSTAAGQQAAAQVFWQEEPEGAFLSTQARVRFFRPEADLALLSVQENWTHPCVWLGETAEPFQSVYSYSFPPDLDTSLQLDSNGTSTTLECEGWTHVGHVRLLKLKDGQVKPGMSGAPLLNVHSGTVCGVIAWTRGKESTLGGRAVLIDMVFRVFPELQEAQQRLQQEDGRWRAAQATLRSQPHISSYDPMNEAMKPPTAVTNPQGVPYPDNLVSFYPRHFVGREEELGWLLTRLHTGGTSAITALGGMGGIGKTALAAVAIKKLLDERFFSDGVAFLSCERQVSAIVLFRQVLTEFHPQRRAPEATDYHGIVQAARSLIGSKRVLIVLDNIEPDLDIEKVVKPLENLGATLLLTARHEFSSSVVSPEASRRLDLLSPQAALDLFAQYFGRSDGEALNPEERAAAERIVQTLERHTLALRLAGAYARSARRDLKKLAGELENLQKALNLKEPGVRDDSKKVAAILAKSLESLDPADAPGKPIRQFFAALTIFAPKGFGRQAALALGAGLGLDNPEDDLDLLITRSLIEAQSVTHLPSEADYERLHLHPLLRALAEREPQQTLDAGLDALANYYVGYLSKVRGVALALDEPNIMMALEWAHEHARYELVAHLCSGMAAFWRDFGRAEATLRYLPWGLEAAERVINETPSHEMYRSLATLKYVYGQFLRLHLGGESDKVEPLLQEALTMFREIGDVRGQSAVLTGLGNHARDQGFPDLAKAYHQEGLKLVSQGQDPWRWAIHKAFLGQLAEREGGKGGLKQAEILLNESVEQYQRLGDLWGEGLALQLLGKVDLRRCQLQQAEGRYRRLLKIHRELGARRPEGVDLNSLGDIALRRGHLAEAREWLEQSLSIRQEVRDRRGEGVDCIFLGQVSQAQGDFDQAEKWFQQGLTIFLARTEPRAQGWAHSCLGQLALQRGHLDEAAAHLRTSLPLRREVKDHPGEAVDLRALGQLAQKQGQLDRAERYLKRALTLARQNEDLQEEARVRYYRAQIAEARGEPERAERLYRQSLALRRQIQADQDIVTSLVALGQLLITNQMEREGCALLQEAVQVAQAAGLPTAQQVENLFQHVCPAQQSHAVITRQGATSRRSSKGAS